MVVVKPPRNLIEGMTGGNERLTRAIEALFDAINAESSLADLEAIQALFRASATAPTGDAVGGAVPPIVRLEDPPRFPTFPQRPIAGWSGTYDLGGATMTVENGLVIEIS